MLFVNDAEIEERLTHPNNVVHKIMHDGKGRPAGVLNIPEEVRLEVATLAKIAGPSVAAEVFDVSASQASNFAKGKTVHGDGNPDLKKKVEAETSDLHQKARNLVLEGLGIMGDKMDELRDESPRVVAGVTKDLATIIEKTSPKEGTGNQINIVVYAPKQKSIDSYETVEAEVIK